MSKHIVVDVESNGPIYGKHSMISFGMVIVEKGLKRTFKRYLKPISNEYVPEAQAVSGYTFEESMQMGIDPKQAMEEAAAWIKQNIKGRPLFWSDNNGYDKPWFHYYCLVYLGEDPFGHSSRRIADFICGVELDLRFKWKEQRRTVHDHDPINDAMGNAEVLLDYFENELKGKY